MRTEFDPDLKLRVGPWHGDVRQVHFYKEMTPEKRPQDPRRNGTALRFEMCEHGGGAGHDAPRDRRERPQEAVVHLRGAGRP
jgi:hypothetical protein